VVICKRLASLMRLVDKPSMTYNVIPRTDQENILDDGFANHVKPQPEKTSAVSDPVLMNIRELLQQKAEREEKERVRLKNVEDVKYAWTMAARVINRLCFVFFTAILLIATVTFLIVFLLNH